MSGTSCREILSTATKYIIAKTQISRQLLLRCSISCVHAVVPLVEMTEKQLINQ